MCSNKIVRMADMPINLVARIFSELNRGKLIIVTDYEHVKIIVKTNPKGLNFPEGWYITKGVFTNKSNTSNLKSYEAKVLDSNGKTWTGTAGCLPD